MNCFYVLKDQLADAVTSHAVTNLVLILRLFVLQEQFQAFLADQRLKVATAAMALFGLITVELALILLFVSLTDHLTFAMVPDDGHSGLQISNMSDLIGEVGVRLTAHS
jgi:hypothetical protein